MTEIHLVTTKIIQTTQPLTKEEFDLIQAMVIVEHTKNDIEKMLMSNDHHLLNEKKDIGSVHFFEPKHYEDAEKIINELETLTIE